MWPDWPLHVPRLTARVWPNWPLPYYKKDKNKKDSKNPPLSVRLAGGYGGREMSRKLLKRITEPPTMIRLSAVDYLLAARKMNQETMTHKRVKLTQPNARVPMLDLLKIWTDATRGAFPDAPMAWTKTDGHILRGELKRHIARNENPQFMELVVWSIQNWSLIMDREFFGMKDKPPYPSIRLFVKCIGKFLYAYSQKDRMERFANMCVATTKTDS